MFQAHVHTNIQETHFNYSNPNYNSYRPSTPQPTLLDSLKLKYSRNHPNTQHSITHRHDQYRSEVSLLKNRYSNGHNCSYKQNSNQHTLRQYRQSHNQGSQIYKEKYQEKTQKGHSTHRNNTRESYESWSKVNPKQNCEKKQVVVAMESKALRKMVEMKIGDRKAPKLVIKDKPIKKCNQNSYHQDDLGVLVRKLDSPIKLIDQGHRYKNTNEQMHEGDTVLKEVKQSQRENRKEKNTVDKSVKGDTLGQQMVREVREARERAEKERKQAVDKIIRNEVEERQARDRQEYSSNTHRKIQAQMRSEMYSTDRTIASIDNILASIRNTLRQ